MARREGTAPARLTRLQAERGPGPARPRGGASGGGWLRVRALALGAVLVALFGVVLARAAQLQLFDRARLSRLARQQTRREIELSPRRGVITDRRGAPLAVTQDVDSVFADPSAFATPREAQAAADKLARALHLDRKKIAGRLASENHFVWLKRRVDEKTADRVRALRAEGLDGVEMVKEPKRFYPQRALAGHVLGFVNDDGGQEGIERALDELLRGKPVSVPALRDAKGEMVLAQGAPDPDALRGATVVLTIDAGIQMIVERELQAAIGATSAAAGWAVVLDVPTGAVLALASAPAFDANQPGKDKNAWRNRAVQDALEPGSTIKSFVVAAALDANVLQPDELLYCEHGVWAHAGRKIHDTHPVDWATPMLVLKESSNICAAKIGEKLGKEQLVASLRAFGFGEKTGLGLPGEGKGALRDPKTMRQIELDTSAYGQGMTATGLQETVAMAAIAAGGVLRAPYLVERVVGPDGAVLQQHAPDPGRRVISEETARKVTAMLEEVTRRGGTGTRAALADFPVAGKTGTAQKVDPIEGGYGKKRLASFLGFVPADAPRLAILVAIDEPEGQTLGGLVAAPPWGAIAREALQQLGVTPPERVEVASPAPLVPPKAALALGSAVSVEAEPVAPPGKAVVPDLAGLAARAAVRRLAERSLEPELTGSGRAVGQSPAAGSIVARGARVKVRLAPPG